MLTSNTPNRLALIVTRTLTVPLFLVAMLTLTLTLFLVAMLTLTLTLFLVAMLTLTLTLFLVAMLTLTLTLDASPSTTNKTWAIVRSLTLNQWMGAFLCIDGRFPVPICNVCVFHRSHLQRTPGANSTPDANPNLPLTLTLPLPRRSAVQLRGPWLQREG